MILSHVWGYNFNPGTNVVDVLVSRLREKIDRDFEPKLLHTVRGVGYVLEPAARDSSWTFGVLFVVTSGALIDVRRAQEPLTAENAEPAETSRCFLRARRPLR